jgi:hypothetical protein
MTRGSFSGGTCTKNPWDENKIFWPTHKVKRTEVGGIWSHLLPSPHTLVKKPFFGCVDMAILNLESNASKFEKKIFLAGRKIRPCGLHQEFEETPDRSTLSLVLYLPAIKPLYLLDTLKIHKP